MLGSYASVRAAELGWDTWATYSEHRVDLPGCRTLPLDIRDATEVHTALQEIRPQAIIHTAAMVRPDICEQRKADCFSVNVLGTRNLVSAAESVGAFFVHVSTDTIFSGRANPYSLDDPPDPINYYGHSKAAAEAAVRSSKSDSAIVRTSIIFGQRLLPFLESFSDKVIDTLRAGKPFKAYADQYRCPIPAWNLADVLLEIADRRLTGVFHAACPEVTSRLQWSRKIADVFALDQSLIEPMYMDETPTIAPRPSMLVLDTLPTQRMLKTRLLGFEEGILDLAKRMR